MSEEKYSDLAELFKVFGDVIKKLRLDEYDSINPGGKYHNKKDLMNFPTFDLPDLVYRKIKPITLKSPTKYSSYFQAFSEKEEIMERIFDIFKDKTIIYISHKKELINMFEKKYEIRKEK